MNYSGRAKFDPPAGTRFGRLTIIAPEWGPSLAPGKLGRRRFRCECDCGTKVLVDPASLKSGGTKSCGCFRREFGAARGTASRRHGQWNHPLYKIWNGVISRCHDPKNPAYSRYGGRGVAVFESWRDSPELFIAWVEQHLGARPEGFSLDRVDNDGNYEPGNLRWADSKTQNNNRRPAARTRWTQEATT